MRAALGPPLHARQYANHSCSSFHSKERADRVRELRWSHRSLPDHVRGSLSPLELQLFKGYDRLLNKSVSPHCTAAPACQRLPMLVGTSGLEVPGARPMRSCIGGVGLSVATFRPPFFLLAPTALLCPALRLPLQVHAQRPRRRGAGPDGGPAAA